MTGLSAASFRNRALPRIKVVKKTEAENRKLDA